MQIFIKIIMNLIKITNKLITSFTTKKNTLGDIPTLKHYVQTQQRNMRFDYTEGSTFKIQIPEIVKFHIETYGCQMNVNDSQIVRSLLSKNFTQSTKEQAHIVLLNTCAIRQAAQEKIYHRINQLKKDKIVGVLGCMAQRIKDKMFEHGVHVVCGPDAYRDLPRLISLALEDHPAINVQLSAEETYAEVSPVRKNLNNVSAYISIMRGCNNMCSFCIVPFVRGRQRSRPLETVLNEISLLEKEGVKDITFLGQNVNSYHDVSEDVESTHTNTQGFSELYKLRSAGGYRFAYLLQKAAQQFPNIRFRFTSPHPKDFPDDLLQVINNNHNICKNIHLPAQSGSTTVLGRMRRNHTRQAYQNLVNKIRNKIPNVSLSTDLMCGFCGETNQQHQESLSLLKTVKFDMAFLYAYSMREKTHAHRNMVDDVSHSIKQERLKQMIDTFVQYQIQANQKQLNRYHVLLIEGNSKRDPQKMVGRTDNFKKGYINHQLLPYYQKGSLTTKQSKVGDYVMVKVKEVIGRSLKCQPIAILSKLSDFQDKLTEILTLTKNQHQGRCITTENQDQARCIN